MVCVCYRIALFMHVIVQVGLCKAIFSASWFELADGGLGRVLYSVCLPLFGWLYLNKRRYPLVG